MEQRTITPQEEEQQKQYKQTKERFRSEIRQRVSDQIGVKQDMKKPSTHQSFAQQQMEINRTDLRNHYAAYAKFRGKSFRQPTKKCNGTLIHPINSDRVNALIKEYGGEIQKAVSYNS